MIVLLGFILLIITCAGVVALVTGISEKSPAIMIIAAAILFFTVNTAVSVVQDKPNTPVAQVQKMVDNATSDK